MTTILADSRCRVMVSDSLMINGSVRARTPKIERIKNCLVATAGTVGVAQAWLDAYISGDFSGFVGNGNDFEAIVMTADGEIFHYEGANGSLITDQVFAIGSGAPHALSAMCAMERIGYEPSAVLAVEVAIEIDPGSGGPIQVFRLDDKPMKQTRKPRRNR